VRSVYSLEAKRKILQLVDDFKPDVAHLQTIHNHISPSIIHALKKAGVPIVWTLHIYTPICQNSTFFCRGEICETCRPNRFYMAILRRCKYDSYVASFVTALAAYVHRALGLYDLVDLYVSPSQFSRSKFVEFGFPPHRIVHLPNFADLGQTKPRFGGDGYGMFLGRLIPEKGVETLLRALIHVPDTPFKIVGDGPCRPGLEQLSGTLGLSNIEFTGYKARAELRALLQGASFVVVPSEWYENMPFSILEAFAYGKPVIATNIGGIPEMVEDGKDGFLFEYRNYIQLAEKIVLLISQPELAIQLGHNAREKAEKLYNEQHHYDRIMEVYSRVIG